VDGKALLSAEHLQQMTSYQVPAENKTPDSFFAGFWDGMGWGLASGYGRGDRCGGGTAGPADRARTSSSTRMGPSASCSPRWSGERTSPLLGEFRALHQAA
jgi:hypothetical protein